MALDRAARDHLAAMLAQYMRGEVDNFALDEVAMGVKTDDEAVLEIGGALWFAYDDNRRHTVHADRRLWETFRRTLAFLRSDLGLPPRKPTRLRWMHAGQLWGVAAAATIVAAVVGAWNGPDLWWFLPGFAVGIPFTAWTTWSTAPDEEPANPWYPFTSEADWRAREHLLAAERLPAFDPAVHGRPLRGRLLSFLMTLGAAVVVVPLVLLFTLLPRRERAAESASGGGQDWAAPQPAPVAQQDI